MIPDVLSPVISRNDIPLAKPKVGQVYGTAVELLKVGYSFEIDPSYQINILMYVKRKFPSRVFTTTWYESKLYLQRLK